jgi:tRNA(Arg) A34 adenosine deaminase TadA
MAQIITLAAVRVVPQKLLSDAIFRLLTASGDVIRSVMARLKTPNFTPVDEERMRELVRFTAGSLGTSAPAPFGALIVNTRTGKRLMRATNAVQRENDPASHGEVRTVRLACRKLGKPSLAGYTMYSTCEPCPMCMANALWAGLDRVVFGATIDDANRYTLQIHIAAAEVARRSDMRCIVEGPFLRELCNTLFTDRRMQKAFRTWSSRKKKMRLTRNGK